jgi:hypothetical protein
LADDVGDVVGELDSWTMIVVAIVGEVVGLALGILEGEPVDGREVGFWVG